MLINLSVITCAHNPRPDYLEQVLDALKVQTLDQGRWEYLLIDNASADPLEARIDLSWHPHARHIREEKLGLTHARLRGIREAQGDVLVFVDDDNVLDVDYLEQVIEVSSKHSMIGAWCGQRRAAFEQQPPAWTKRHWSHLALHEFQEDIWSNQLDAAMPNGAGLCVRRRVAAYYADLHSTGKRAFVMDRSGDSLVSGGDVDLASCACDIGLGVGLFAALKLQHLIPSNRLTEEYLLRLAEGIGYSGVILDSFRPTVTRPHGWSSRVAELLRYLLLDSREKNVHRATKRGRAKARKDLAAAVQKNPTEVRAPSEWELEAR